LIAEGPNPKGNRYHWKYQPLMEHPRADSVRALIAVCSNETTAPQDIPQFLALATQLGIGSTPTGTRRSTTAFSEAANQHTAAVARKLMVEQKRREEIEGCAQPLGLIYTEVVRDLHQIVEDVKTLGVSVRADNMYASSSIFDALRGLSVGENTMLWHCTGSAAYGQADIRLVAHYEPVHESVWPVEFRIWCPGREIPNSRVRHRRDGTLVDHMSLSPTNPDQLQRALEWILKAMMTVGPG
jgi:hypothetical protein